MTGAPQRLLAGHIGKPHGLAGEVYVVPLSDDPHRFDSGSELTHEDGRVLVVQAARAHRTRFLVKFEGIDGRDAAETLRGALYVPLERVRELDDDEFWEHDVLGALVVRRDGSPIGTVTGLEAGPGQDRLIVATERGERYIPVVKEIVVDVDVLGRRVTVDPPEGLLE